MKEIIYVNLGVYSFPPSKKIKQDSPDKLVPSFGNYSDSDSDIHRIYQQQLFLVAFKKIRNLNKLLKEGQTLGAKESIYDLVPAELAQIKDMLGVIDPKVISTLVCDMAGRNVVTAQQLFKNINPKEYRTANSHQILKRFINENSALTFPIDVCQQGQLSNAIKEAFIRMYPDIREKFSLLVEKDLTLQNEISKIASSSQNAWDFDDIANYVKKS